MTDDRTPRNRGAAAHLPDVLYRRGFIAAGGVLSAGLLAGCTGTDGDQGTTGPGGDEDAGAAQDGSPGSDDGELDGATFRLLISDRPADIGDFDRLEVTLDRARIFPTGSEESDDDPDTGERETEDDGTDTDEDDGVGGNADAGTEETGDDGESETDSPEDGDRAFHAIDLDDVTVDLTTVVGNRATPVSAIELEPGTYTKIELHVAAVDGVVDEEPVTVKVPSGKLQITHEFEVRADAPVDFVFDINVVKRGQEQRYNLTPVISESGVAGEDVEVDEVDPADGGNGPDEGDENEETDGGEDDEGGDAADEAAPDGNEDDAGGGSDTDGADSDGNDSS